MKGSPWFRLLLVMVLVAPISCFTDRNDSSTSGDTANASGSLAQGNFILSWRSGATWAEGACMNLTLINYGPDLEYWQLDVRMDQAITSWISFDGALMTYEGDVVTITPIQSAALDYGQEFTFQYCAEPMIVPEVILDTNLTEAEPTPEPVLNSLYEDPILLSWRPWGQSYGGECLELTITNLSLETVFSWEVVMYMSGGTTLTDYFGVTPVINGSIITLYPGQGGVQIEPYGFQTGTICMKPLVYPMAMDAQAVQNGTSTADPTPTDGEVIQGNLTDEPLLLTYRTTTESKGGQCVEYTFTNVGSAAIESWYVSLNMTDVVTLTDWWSLTPVPEGSTLKLYPAENYQSIDLYQSRSGTICSAPLVIPNNMVSNVTYAQ